MNFIMPGFALFLLLSSVVSASTAGNDYREWLDAETLFKSNAKSMMSLSPSGDLIAYVNGAKVMVGNNTEGFHKIYTSSSNQDSLVDVKWAGDRTIYIGEKAKASGGGYHKFIQIKLDDGKVVGTDFNYFQRDGYVVDFLKNDGSAVLFAQFEKKKDLVYSNVFKLNLFKSSKGQFKNRFKLNKSSNILFWKTNKKNKLSLGVGRTKNHLTLWKPRGRSNKTWKKIWQIDNKYQFRPLKLSADEKTLWVLTDKDRDKLALVEFDLEKAKIVSTVYEHPKYDLGGAAFSLQDQHPTAVMFYEGGLRHYEKLNDNNELIDNVQKLFPDQKVIITHLSQDESKQIILALASDNPGIYYYCQLSGCEKIGHVKPWLTKFTLSKTTYLKVKTDDDFEIDAFLTIPVYRNGSKVPLIVIPHGGPIGISDTRYFNPETQWLAYNGYAVLRVNYRGSSGYGKKFREAGMRQWGKAIEADIKAARIYAMSQYDVLDKQRVCIYGSSYGGYSALISIIIEPEVYRCAASFAGVTDLTLMFNRSLVQEDHELDTLLRDIVGDPIKEQKNLQKHSPVYLYKKLNTPLFIAHGTADRIVDIEHSWRLKKMLDLAGKDYQWLVMDKTGHGFINTDEVEIFYNKLLSFFDKHLRKNSDTMN